ncbi:ATP-binding protein [Hamadaea sp. NPDC050747]|uniref:ATP-binding protein n=1 Tax=Hamadaea sp. NPDC050747 TaxID=3155789 RepID=UPI003408624D
MSYDIVNPDPAGTIASLRAMGYTIQAAVADLVDNSIAANARQIDIWFTWDGQESWIAIADDGDGMTQTGLVEAMTVAGRGFATARSQRDLGRFGMGLKSASFSQSGQLTVASAALAGQWAMRTWNLGIVQTSGEWRLLRDTDSETEAIRQRVQKHDRGTVVIWRELHRYNDISEGARSEKQFYEEMHQVEAHLGMVFARFLVGRNRLRIIVNGESVEPWDPFLQHHPSVQRLPVEDAPSGGGTVRIEAFILPHLKRLSLIEQQQAAGPAGWLDQQGFYLYRRNRLILAGDWLGIRGFRRDDRYNLARIAVDIPAEADRDWSIDVRKSTAVPPTGVRRHLKRLGTAARARAAEVVSHRGRIAARTHAASFTYAWRVSKNDGRIRLRINREHPLVNRVLSGSGGQRDLLALLRLVEETVPVATLRILHETDAADDPEPFTAASDDAVRVAERICAAMEQEGLTTHEARRRLALMPPFDEMDGFWRATTD